jgi:hypothetical protein
MRWFRISIGTPVFPTEVFMIFFSPSLIRPRPSEMPSPKIHASVLNPYVIFWKLTAKSMLAQASTMILSSESHGTHDSILLSAGSGSVQSTWILIYYLGKFSHFQRMSKSKLLYTGVLPPISSYWRQAPWDSRPEFLFQLNPCHHGPYVTSSLTRRWVWLFWICLSFPQVYVLHV